MSFGGNDSRSPGRGGAMDPPDKPILSGNKLCSPAFTVKNRCILQKIFPFAIHSRMQKGFSLLLTHIPFSDTGKGLRHK